jgi:ring-1,2-phenylacetyl-CoA epoxidase subunit PaaC
VSEATELRRPTRVGPGSDIPDVDAAAISPALREGLAELLLTMADDEFVQGFRDSEWTGIAPMLEEDVAFSSLAQDEIGHARVLYGLRAALTGEDPDELAFGRPADDYRHCRLLDHPRHDWAFTIARRYLYDTADSTRLAALRESSWRPLADVVAKIRREETYHLMHLDAWVRRLGRGGEPRQRLEGALARLWPDAQSVFAPLDAELVLVEAAVLAESMDVLAARHWANLTATFAELDIAMPAQVPEVRDGRRRMGATQGFRELWTEFTSVRRLEPGATW